MMNRRRGGERSGGPRRRLTVGRSLDAAAGTGGGEAVEVVIERLGAQGDGVSTDGVFVPLSLPGERVSIKAAGDRAEILAILEASPQRRPAPCPHFGQCGGCVLQHLSEAAYMTWKIEQLRLVLDRAGVDTDLLSPFIAGPGERRRVALHARKGGASGAILGFKARRSWSVVALSACVVAEPRLQDALPRLSRLAVPFLEHPKSAPILHVTATDSGLAVEVTGVQGAGGGLSADARAAACTAAEAANVAQVTLGGEVLYQARPPLVSFGRAMVVLPPGGFLQAVARAEEAMASIAVEALAGCGRVADLFCGSGAFTFRLAERFSVQALDASEDAVVALRAGRGGASGMKAIAADVRDLYRRPLLAAEMKGIDGALLDPPRAGALDSVGEIGRSKLAVAVYVSCNPATFARDAAVLIGSGFRLTSVTPVDQFLWSPHMELVGVFHR